MTENVFLQKDGKTTLSDYMGHEASRANLGDTLPVMVYRLFEFAFREQLSEQFGKEMQIDIFRKAGFRAGTYFAEHVLDLALGTNEFIAMLQNKMEEMSIGVLRIERIDRETGKITLTVAEDADCSGLPLLGETVCNYDEGFLSGILSAYTGKPYLAQEIDCWATGDRVCRFVAEPCSR